MRQPAKSAARVDVAVRAAVQAYVQGGHQDWRELASFCDQHYVRHLVDESANVEMMLICWKKGQASRVHNHGSSHCYLTVLSGGVEELRFTTGDTPLESEPTLAPRLPGVIAATSPCPLLLPDGVNHVCVGTTAYINDSMGLHAVRCDDAACGGPGAEEGAVSLHIYAPPIRRVRLYEPEADRVVTRAPGFRTIRGVEEEDQMDASLLSSTL
ncbi:cysteine dioxygenase [Micractinium conductrix]|uniref:Cysteine dioxygenase n=1 Tax=Micractinium conductrix TaxID=554055 RepID=A0A2P6V6W8_9CHLO|nr:cysteine dioxygenase [Micractinium conductrix]|eukprot:PSC69833.1 cysteine dioxygenase [Micractinium conductrix]